VSKNLLNEIQYNQNFTRGTANHNRPTLSSSFGRSSRPIVIENIIVLDGQVIDKRIKE
jgi:hypothetical protein